MILLIIEIIIVGFLARRLGSEAHDKGFSNILFMVLTTLIWIGSRVIGNLIGHLLLHSRIVTLIMGWIVALIGYILFYYLISRIPDKELFNTDNSWKTRNDILPPEEREENGDKKLG